jgi:hypothetical protein
MAKKVQETNWLVSKGQFFIEFILENIAWAHGQQALKCNISFNSMFFENAKLKNFEVTLKVIIWISLNE